MKKYLIGVVLGLPFFTFGICPEHVLKARDTGADTKVVFRVIDDVNAPVSNATVEAAFYMNGRKGYVVAGLTDKDGVFIAENKSVGEINYFITKDKYYETDGRIDFRDSFNWAQCVKDDKWQPYGKTYTILLKPRKNPIHAVAYCFATDISLKDVTAGFDLEVGDLLLPYGKGIVADFFITYSEDMNRKICKLTFPSALDGAYLKDKDPCSFFSVYNASVDEIYKKEFSFTFEGWNDAMPEHQYLVLRTRTKKNDKGELIEAYYSRIEGGFGIDSTGLRFYYRRNPKKNSTNMEFKLKNDWKHRPL